LFSGGLLTDAIKMMEIVGQDWGELQKLTVLQFDEVKVKYTYEIDKKTDTVVGPHEQLQCIMARGLFSKFKQPIFCEFDQAVTPEILNTAIKKLYDVGFKVVGVVSDNASTNTCCLSDLGNYTFFICNIFRILKIY
jgi:Transposase protein